MAGRSLLPEASIKLDKVIHYWRSQVIIQFIEDGISTNIPTMQPIMT